MWCLGMKNVKDSDSGSDLGWKIGAHKVYFKCFRFVSNYHKTSYIILIEKYGFFILHYCEYGPMISALK